MNKKRLVMIEMIFIFLILVNFVNAEFWACFNEGESFHYCGGYKPDWTCENSNGCQKCMSVYREEDDCYIHGAWPKCLQLPPECTIWGGDIDINPPEITINSPLQDGIYTSRSLMLNIETNEKADIYYLDNINGRERWKRICSGCFGYDGKKSFKEGLNNLTFKAEDVIGNEVEEQITFFIDSKNPRIKKINPRRGFADGNFHVEFQEENPESLILYYGDENHELDLENDCYLERKKYYCDVDVSLEQFDGQEIEYYFFLEDVAGNSDESKHAMVEVDTTFPVIEQLNYEINGRRVEFEIKITEENFDEAFYSYVDEQGRLKEKRLCSRLKDGICSARKSFREGEYGLTIQVIDEAGNLIGVPVSFSVE